MINIEHLPVSDGGRPVRHRLGYGISWPPSMGRANSIPLSGFPKSLYTSKSYMLSDNFLTPFPSPLRNFSSFSLKALSPAGVSLGKCGCAKLKD